MSVDIGQLIWYGLGLVCLVGGFGGLALLVLNSPGNSSEEES